MVGDGSAMLVRQAFAATGAPPADEAEPPVLYAGVAGTLAALAGQGVRLGLCTNKP